MFIWYNVLNRIKSVDMHKDLTLKGEIKWVWLECVTIIYSLYTSALEFHPVQKVDKSS